MASIEKRGRTYRIVFRFARAKFARSLKTTSQRAAQASLARVEDNLRRVELGTLTVPEGADVATFLLTDGQKTAKLKLSEISTLGQLFDAYFAALPERSLEQNTLACMYIHRDHFVRVLRASFRIHSLQLGDLQRYVDTRSGEPGLRGRTVSPTTIKKELATLTTAWNWAMEIEIVQRPLPKKRLRYPKTTEKPRFQTWAEIERKILRGGLTEYQEADLWDCVFLVTEQIEELLAYVRQHAAQPFVYPLFMFAAHTGARRSEIIRSEIDDIDLDARSVTIREKKRVRGRLTTRTVPISVRLHDVLSSWLRNHPGGLHSFCHQDSPTNSRSKTEPLTKDDMAEYFSRTLTGSNGPN